MGVFVHFRGGPWDHRVSEWSDPPHVVLVPMPPPDPNPAPVTGVLADLQADLDATPPSLSRPDGRYVCQSLRPYDFTTDNPATAVYRWEIIE